jgi:hypothetical protein
MKRVLGIYHHNSLLYIYIIIIWEWVKHGDVGKPTYVLEDEYEMLSLAVSALPFAAST